MLRIRFYNYETKTPTEALSLGRGGEYTVITYNSYSYFVLSPPIYFGLVLAAMSFAFPI